MSYEKKNDSKELSFRDRIYSVEEIIEDYEEFCKRQIEEETQKKVMER